MSPDSEKQKFVDLFVRDYTGKCPVCKEQGHIKVLPFGDDMWFCENPNCEVTRHSNIGYYKTTEEPIQTPNVTLLQPSMINKRK